MVRIKLRSRSRGVGIILGTWSLSRWFHKLRSRSQSWSRMIFERLHSPAHHYGSQYDKPDKEFMLCCWEEKDPRKCLNEGKKVNECALKFSRKVTTRCAEPFTAYWTCLDYNVLLDLSNCRQQQYAFDNFALDKYGWVRP